MKKVIELLEEAKRFADIGLKNDVIWNINDALEELENPLRYTPEQWEQRTGEPWPENWPVWVRAKYITGGYSPWELDFLKEIELYTTQARGTIQVIVFNGNKPPPEDWMPDEES
jgi:hypothetical protein